MYAKVNTFDERARNAWSRIRDVDHWENTDEDFMAFQDEMQRLLDEDEDDFEETCRMSGFNSSDVRYLLSY
jgi:hypothetical protein|nr:MAG TPA: hypothetical protein [Caudoviricetes sp.]